MKKIDKIKKFIRILILIMVIAIGIYVLVLLPNKKNILKEGKKIKFDYILYERDTDLYKNIFDKLDITLEENPINYEKYAEYVSQLFIIDLYTLNNKLSKDDIGGIQYIKESIKDNYKLNLQNTLYKYIESNLDNSRVQELPIVKNIITNNIEKGTYKIENIDYESYIVNLKWEYNKDLGYDKEGTIILIKEDDKLVIVEKK